MSPFKTSVGHLFCLTCLLSIKLYGFLGLINDREYFIAGLSLFFLFVSCLSPVVLQETEQRGYLSFKSLLDLCLFFKHLLTEKSLIYWHSDRKQGKNWSDTVRESYFMLLKIKYCDRIHQGETAKLSYRHVIVCLFSAANVEGCEQNLCVCSFYVYDVPTRCVRISMVHQCLKWKKGKTEKTISSSFVALVAHFIAFSLWVLVLFYFIYCFFLFCKCKFVLPPSVLFPT